MHKCKIIVLVSLVIVFTLKILKSSVNLENEAKSEAKVHFNRPFNTRSIMCSFGWGRLGNQASQDYLATFLRVEKILFFQMSVFATLFAIEQQHKIIAYSTAKQAQMLLSYFKMESILPKIKILEMHHPEYKDFNWIRPFRQWVVSCLFTWVS